MINSISLYRLYCIQSDAKLKQMLDKSTHVSFINIYTNGLFDSSLVMVVKVLKNKTVTNKTH